MIGLLVGFLIAGGVLSIGIYCGGRAESPYYEVTQ